MDEPATREQTTQLRRRRDNSLALLSILVGSGFVIAALWATGFIVFVPIVAGIALYAVIARVFFRVFGVDTGPTGLPARSRAPSETPAPVEENVAAVDEPVDETRTADREYEDR